MYLRSLYEGIRMGSSDMSMTPKKDYTIGFEFEVGLPDEAVHEFDDEDDYDDSVLGETFPYENFMKDWLVQNRIRDVSTFRTFLEDNDIEPKYGYNILSDDDIMELQTQFDDRIIEKYGEDLVEEIQDILLDFKDNPQMELSEDQLHTIFKALSEYKGKEYSDEQIEQKVSDIQNETDVNKAVSRILKLLETEFLFNEEEHVGDNTEFFTSKEHKDTLSLDEIYDVNDLIQYFNVDMDDLALILEHDPDYEQDLAVALEEYTDNVTGGDTDAIKTVRNMVSEELGEPVIKESSTTQWSVDEDGTIGVDAEIRSPILTLDKGIKSMNQIFDLIRNTPMFTSQVTGFHVNIGTWSGEEYNNIDWLKFLVIISPSRILSQFGRTGNTYAMDFIDRMIKGLDQDDFRSYATAVRKINQNVIDISEKYSAVNLSKLRSYGYIELRAPGNSGYELRGDEMTALIRRVVRALDIAGDPNAFKQQYLKKLYMMINKHSSPTFKKKPTDVYEFFEVFTGKTIDSTEPLISLEKIVSRITEMLKDKNSQILSEMDKQLQISFVNEMIQIFKTYINNNELDSEDRLTLTVISRSLKKLPQESKTVMMLSKLLKIINGYVQKQPSV